MILQRILNNKPEIIDTLTILDERKTSYTVEQFVSKIEKWKLKSS